MPMEQRTTTGRILIANLLALWQDWVDDHKMKSNDVVECRGRWRDTQRINNTYTAISLPFIDANVAATLCVGGAAKYEPKEGSGVTDHWLVSEFVPQIAGKLGNRVAIVLGKALLWCLAEPLMTFAIPDCLRTRLEVRYLSIQQLEEKVNPINRIQISVYHSNGELHIDPSLSLFPSATGDEQGQGGEAVAAAFRVTGDSQQALISQNHAIRRRVEELFNTVRNNNEVMIQSMKTLQKVVQRVANGPARINHGFHISKFFKNIVDVDVC